MQALLPHNKTATILRKRARSTNQCLELCLKVPSKTTKHTTSSTATTLAVLCTRQLSSPIWCRRNSRWPHRFRPTHSSTRRATSMRSADPLISHMRTR